MTTPSPADAVADTCRLAGEAFVAWRQTPARRAETLDAVAAALDARRGDVVSTAAEETALTPDELAPEFDRMTGTLRMFAALIGGSGLPPDRRSPFRAAISRKGDHALGPNHDVRSMLVPLGPVAVFGSSNFPLAYGVCGGDTASALAAGCPVVVKEHPAHPLTGRLIRGIARAAATAAGVHESLLGYIENTDPRDFSVAEQLVQHPAIRAVGFTGSIPGGLAIEHLARERGTPIPVFAEMGSNNVVVITPAAAAARAEEIADELAASILQRFGQQCTRPGTIIVGPDPHSTRLVNRLAERISASTGRQMLAPWVRDAYARRLAEIEACRGVRLAARGGDGSGPRAGSACLFCVDNLHIAGSNIFHSQPTLREEVFGPAAIVVRLPVDRLSDLGLRPSLTHSIYFEHREIGTDADGTFDAAVNRGVHAAGRIIFNGVPTGVRVAEAMVHGGPFPATNRPDTTAVGPRAIERWCRPVCWQNAPRGLLPTELRDQPSPI